jgi:hypothetical protein
MPVEILGDIIMNNKVSIIWRSGKPQGAIELSSGQLVSSMISSGEGAVDKASFAFSSAHECRLDLEIANANISYGSYPTMVKVDTAKNPFTFMLRDICMDYPVYIPEYGVIVTSDEDKRTYDDISKYINGKGLQTKLQRIDSEPEENWEQAADNTRKLRCPTWLGLSRDMRIFEVTYNNQQMWHFIQPRNHGMDVLYPGTSIPMLYKFMFGRGVGCSENITRRLEDGIYPILHGEVKDGGISYNFISFAGLEKTPLTAETLRGTHFLVADRHGHGNMMTDSQLKQYEQLLPEEMNRDEETVLYTRIEAVNTDPIPRYAWFKAPVPYGPHEIPAPGGIYEFNGDTGFSSFEDGKIFVAAKLNNKPLPKEEVAVLIMPGETAVFEFYIPHKPISADRAAQLINNVFEDKHKECRLFWEEKQRSATKINLPEKRIEEMIKAGLYHLDIITFGLEPDGSTAPTIGLYCSIGSESSPIIQSMDSFGWHKLAERSLGYFIEKQHEDGFIQNFGGYMLETGAALWSMGEHYRYTRNIEWVRKHQSNFIKACDYMLAWRDRNKKEELRGRGYGMLDGKVADPEDPYRAFMLNGYAYLGMIRAAEMLADVNPNESKRIAEEAVDLKNDIRTAIYQCLAKSPVIPLGDGRWCPALPPWAEARGAISLLIDENRCYTHGAFTGRDSLTGTHYLILQEVLDPNEQAAEWLMESLAEMMYVRNVALSQPYYSIHPYIHIRRGEVKAFIKAYYNGISGLADRETYTFWEHYMHHSPHKTHEEGWFLMQSRWMLYIEDGKKLNLLSAIPRAWMEQGKCINIENAATYFGDVSFSVVSDVENNNRITAHVCCSSDRKPESVEIRLPHPQNRRAIKVTGGTYNKSNESVLIGNFNGDAHIILEF